MQTCSICKDPLPALDGPIKSHLVVGMRKDGHVHTHGDLEKKASMTELLHAAGESLGVEISQKFPLEDVKTLVFNNKQRIGDSIVFTCAIRDFARAFPKIKFNARLTARHIIDYNPYIDPSIDVELYKKMHDVQLDALSVEEKETKTIFNLGEGRYFVKIGPKALTDKSNSLDWHFANGYRFSMEKALGIHIPQGESRGDLYFTEEEYHAARPFPMPYWVICVNGEKGWGCKMYPFEHWQKVVDLNQDKTFVQIGTKKDNAPRLQGKNVIDMVGKTDDGVTGIRDLFKLFLNAEGSIGLVSFHMHLSGALYKPCVVVAGAREPVSFTRYPGHAYLATDGMLPCATKACWHCAIETCTNIVKREDRLEKQIPRCVDMISPEDVSKALNGYYEGGLLKVGIPSEKPKIKKRVGDLGVNVVPTPVSRPESVPNGFDAKARVGLDWGKGAIDPMDWPFLEEVVKKNQVKTILEFGAGLSTILFSKLLHEQGYDTRFVGIQSYETEQEWIDKVLSAAPDHLKSWILNVTKWNGREAKVPAGAGWDNSHYDLAFVDGPANGQNREEAFRLAANHARIVVVHDATREHEARFEAKYLKPGFTGPIKGGRWCHLWIKTPSFVEFAPPALPPSNPEKKRIRIVSTARGFGGCARSITTIMRLHVKAGHDVEFVPFRGAVTSKELIDIFKNELHAVRVEPSLDVLREHCDVLLVYADDYVWEFPKLEEAFANVNAGRKIMMVNYRRGGIGEIPWTKGWDRYLFLNSAQEKDLLRLLPDASTAVYPPCTDLSPFFEAKINYGGPVRIVRHNSQGDTKFDKATTQGEIASALMRPDLEIHMLPGPSFVAESERFHKYTRTGMPGMIRSFLEKGNLFWYSLPKGYDDMGPRVILEAMAAGLPVIADNWGGAPDRVTPETGWICNSKEEMLEIIKNVTPEELERKGKAARERALREFRPERWIEELTGELVNV